MLKRNILLYLILVVIPFSIVSATDFGGYAGAFLQLSVNPRAAALGNAYTAVSDDAAGIFFNPAALTQKNKILATANYRDMSLGRSLQQVAIIFPVRDEAAIGLSAEIASTSNVIGRNNRGETTGELDNLDAVVGVTFARKFSPIISIGGNARYFHKKLDNISAYSAGFDIGAMLHLLREDETLPENGFFDVMRAGIVVRNISAKYPWSSTDTRQVTNVTENVPITVKIGLSGIMLKKKLLIALDTEKDEKNSVKFRFGGEYWLVPQVALRAGLDNSKPTFGAGFKVPISTADINIDIAVEEANNIGGWESIFGINASF